MKKNRVLRVAAAGLMMLSLSAGWGELPLLQAADQHEHAAKDIYYCPMHPSFTSDKPGSCPICGMDLVKKEAAPVSDPRKEAASSSGVSISSERQQLAGVKKETVSLRPLSRIIRASGVVAYDRDLFSAQEECVQALRLADAASSGPSEAMREQSRSLADAVKSRLVLLGMSETEISALALAGAADRALYLPEGGRAWVYLTVYEYESAPIVAGTEVEITAGALPGKIFYGKVAGIVPVVEEMTRGLKARVLVEDAAGLKPQMFVDARIRIDLGKVLAVSEEAVMRTGARAMVVVAHEAGHFASREVTLGAKAERYYEVKDGLQEGDTVVTSGNFLIDSESRLQSAISGEHAH